MISIGTDLGGLILQNTLTANTLGLNHSIERMTTGYKINRAKDDAAGFAIAEGLSTKISSMIMVQQNVEEGIALLKTAEGALDNILGLLQRLRDLAEQAGNDVYGEDSRQALQAEADEIIEQIEQIKNTTEFNGLNLFEAPEPTTTKQTSGRPFGLSNAKVNIQNDSVQMGHSGAEGDSAASVPSFTSILDAVDEEIKDLSSSIKSNTSFIVSNSPAPKASDISGAEDFGAKESKVITIDGVEYTITNKLSSSSTISYLKDSSTGQVTFIAKNFIIEGQKDVSHNLLIKGNSNTIYGGNLADKFEISDATSTGNVIYAGEGNDTIIDRVAWQNTSYGEGGDDTFELRGAGASVHGGAGNDTFNIYTSRMNVWGDAGDDTFNVLAGDNNKLYGNDGEDSFVVKGRANVVDGGAGTNSITDSGTER